MPNFNHVVIGGTFDKLHAGHRSLIDTALGLGNKVTIGLTSDSYAGNKTTNIDGYSARYANVAEYILKQSAKDRVSLVEINDEFGITLNESAIDAIIVTNNTKPNALLINKKRVEKNLDKIKIITIPYQKGPDGKIISSSRIRNGEIDRNGSTYLSLFPKKKLYLPQSLREALKKPLGILVDNERSLPIYIKKENRFLITIGDVVSRTVCDVGLSPNLMIIDYKTQRHQIEHDILTQKKIRNQSGTIAPKAVTEIWKILYNPSGQSKIIISGEEDLLAIPAILFAPLSGVVLYGLANKGIVVIDVDETMKSTVKAIIEKFSDNPQTP